MPDKQIIFEPFPKQQEFIEAAFSKLYRYILFGGGIRGGKTWGGLGTLILLAKVYPYSRWAVVRDSLQTLKRNTIPSFKKIAPSNVKALKQACADLGVNETFGFACMAILSWFTVISWRGWIWKEIKWQTLRPFRCLIVWIIKKRVKRILKKHNIKL